MTLEETNIDPEELQRVRDRSLEEAYEVHDIGQDMLIARLEASGFHVVEHGDDARHADEVFFGDGPDLAVYRDVDEDGNPVDLLCYIEIKCKEAVSWFGRCNRRHYNEYVNFSKEVETPVFIWFALVEQDSPVIHREAFVEVEDSDQLSGKVHDVTEQEVVFHEKHCYELSADSDLLAVEAEDLIEVRNGDIIVDGIPDVWGNDVIELDDDYFRSYAHVLYQINA